MSTISDQMISSVIRRINARNFSENVHGPGQAVNYDIKSKVATLKGNGLLERFILGRNVADYYLKQLNKPLVLESIPFTWKEGTNHVSLEFNATFQLLLNTRNIEECIAIVKALHHPQGVGYSLYEIIDGCIDKVLSEQYRQCQTIGDDLLSLFCKSGVLQHDSADLDRRVSESVQKQLGISHFNIGLRLTGLPPQYLEIKCETSLDIRDVEEQKYKVKTKADIELSNYQLYKQQGFDREKHVEEAIRCSIQADIHRAVRKHVFNFGYFDLIESFYTSTVANEDDAISKRIEADIKTMVANKGYKIKLFHTLCDIPPLVLIDQGMRISLNPDVHQFKTRDSNLPISVNLTLSLHLKSFKKVKSLIKPEYDAKRMECEITEQIFNACKDVLSSASIFEFDLAFDDAIRKKLTDKLAETLSQKYGFEFAIVTMQPMLSENKERLDALINETCSFDLSVTAQADGGGRDQVDYQGAFIVTGMDPQGYHRFVAKDYGFCKTSSKRSESAYLMLAERINRENGKSLSIHSAGFEQEWKRYCIDTELKNLAMGIKINSEEYFSKESDVAAKTRNFEASKQLRLITEDLGLQFARAEFGLKIKITQFKRLDTATEIETIKIRMHNREMREIYLQDDKASLLSKLSNDSEQRNQASDLKAKKLKQAFADEELSREDLDKELELNAAVARHALFEELNSEMAKNEQLNVTAKASLLDGKRTPRLFENISEVEEGKGTIPADNA